MMKTMLQILLVVVVVGVLAWARPDLRQKFSDTAAQVSAGIQAGFVATVKAFSQSGAQISAYFRANPIAGLTTKPAPMPKIDVQAFFKAVGQQLTRVIDSISVWFKANVHFSAQARPHAWNRI